MASGTVQRTIALFMEALHGLHVDIPLIQIEVLGIMVHEAMSTQARSFHTPPHISSSSSSPTPSKLSQRSFTMWFLFNRQVRARLTKNGDIIPNRCRTPQPGLMSIETAC